MESTWVVPGAPLEGGQGWRIWYSKPTRSDFAPPAVRITRNNRAVAAATDFVLLDPVDGVDRRMGVQTVRLAEPDPRGNAYQVAVNGAAPRTWRTLPGSLDEPVTFFVSSCFWRDNDREGAYGAGITELTRLHQPAFKLLVGDQVYLDWPPAPPGGDAAKLNGDRYAAYWGDPSYREVLASSPNVFLCDDHEFWNDYPERQAQLARTWRKREAFGRVAQEQYALYQLSANGLFPPPGGHDRRWLNLRIGPVGIFVTDSRSQRTEYNADPAYFFSDAQFADLEAWCRDLEGPGLLVLGQPLFQKDGDFKDHSLSNFRECHGRLCKLIFQTVTGTSDAGRGTPTRPPHDILILTGDIHRGRFSTATFPGVGDGRLYEFVASPASRIGPYIRTPDPEPPPPLLRPVVDGVQKRWEIAEDAGGWTPMIDNNVGVVRMSQGTGGRVRFELSIWRHRPYDDRSFWKRTIRAAQPQGPIAPLYRKEIQLR